MSDTTALAKDRLHELERQYFAWEGVFSLIRTLGTSLEVDRVATLSLMTVTGQLLVQKAALYIVEPGEAGLVLCQSLGVRPNRLQRKRIYVPKRLHDILLNDGGVARLKSSYGLPADILDSFQYGSYMVDDSGFVGLLLLGHKLDGREFDGQDARLLETMGVVMGMTMKKALLHEQVAQAMDRMEKAEILRKAIIDHVSHELNTPLMVVKDSAEMLRGADPELQDEFWGMHSEAVDRLQQLVSAITLVADSDETDADKPTWIDEADLIASVVKPVLSRARDRGIDVSFHFDPESGVQVRVSPQKLGAALDRLLDNAWGFRRDSQPWVVVNCYAVAAKWWAQQDHASRIDLYDGFKRANMALKENQLIFSEGNVPAAAADADHLVLMLEIIDSGIGIPEDECEAVFEPFRQASNSPTLGVRGAGMGLTAARKLARDMSGEIELRSVAQVGSVFGLSLPARYEEAEPCHDDEEGASSPA